MSPYTLQNSYVHQRLSLTTLSSALSATLIKLLPPKWVVVPNVAALVVVAGGVDFIVVVLVIVVIGIASVLRLRVAVFLASDATDGILLLSGRLTEVP